MTDEPHQFSGGVLKVDLAALRANYRMFARMAAPAECGAAVKADAYGFGIQQVGPALWSAGCRTYFVALTREAVELRGILPQAIIYVLNGLAPGASQTLLDFALRPCLCSLEEVDEWVAFCSGRGKRLPAALHIESGINRFGLTGPDVGALARDPESLAAFDLSLVMSHLASGDDPDATSNTQQIDRFDALRSQLPPAPASLSNSPGILLGQSFHYDLVRPGIGLYGGRPQSAGPSPVKPVAHLVSHLAQVRSVAKGQGVGYAATWMARRDSRIGVIPVGYADGYRRSLSSDPEIAPAKVWIGGHFAPVVGRISMDMITVDVTDLPPETAVRGAEVELFGSHVLAHELAARAGTISYEVFTGLGSRFARVYSGHES
ncbi:MAG: alanine racemase [Pseudomonadota bacterium]